MDRKNEKLIIESAVFLSIYTNNWLEDPECLMQFALAVLFDKPLFFLIEKGTKISKHLIRILEGYEFFEPGNNESLKQAQTKLFEKISKFLKKNGKI